MAKLNLYGYGRVKDVAAGSRPRRRFLKRGQYTFEYDYPLNGTHTFKHLMEAGDNEQTILAIAARDYRKIYKTPEKYGVWGHDIGDLYFEGIVVDTVKRTIKFDMGS